MSASCYLSVVAFSIALVFRIIAPALALAQQSGPVADEDSQPARKATARPKIGDPVKQDLPSIAPGQAITLTEALKLTEERNLSLNAVREDIESARAGLQKSWAPLLPTAQGTMTLTHHDHEDVANLGGGAEIVTRKQDSLQGGLQASMPLVNAQLWAGVGAGNLGVEVAELTVDNARQALLLTAAQAFYRALTARALIDVQENLFRTSLRHLEVARTRHVSGVGNRLDVIRARSEVVRIRQELLAAHSAFENARDALGILSGTGGLPMPDEGPALREPPDAEQELVTRAVNKREDLKLRRKMISLSEKQLDMSWLQFVPTLNASWQLTHQFTSPSSFGSQDRSRWSAFLTLTVPIYNQTRYADLDEKRAAIRKARIEAEYSKQNIALEIRTAKRDYETSIKQLEAAEEQASLSREALLLAQSAYENGTGTSLEVTDASRSSRQDAVNLAIKQFDVQLALLKLLRAAGEDMRHVAGSESR